MMEWINEKFPDTNWTELGVTYGGKLLALILVLLIGLWIARIVRKLITKGTMRAGIEETLARFFGNMGRYVVLVILVVAILGMFGIETTSLAAVLAAAGFAVGMALQGTLGNFAAGVMLLIFRPFKIGDVVNAAGVTGKVVNLELFSTEMNTPDNRRIIVPNGAIFGSTIENMTHHDTRRASIAVGCDYDADIDKTRKVLEESLADIEGMLQNPAPQVFLSSLGASSVDWEVRVWAKTSELWDVHQSATRAVKAHLDKAGIGIPYPQMDVHVDGALTK